MSGSSIGRAVLRVKRERGLGGGDAVAVLGLSPYRTPHDVWLQKRGAQSSFRDAEAARLGKRLEPVVAELYSETTGRHLRELDGLLQHPAHDFLVGQVDRLVVGEPTGVELKVTSSRRGYGPSGTAEVPVGPYVQCQHLMYLSGFESWDVAALIEGTRFSFYTIPADRSFQVFLGEYLCEFWRRHVLAGAPPAGGPEFAANSWNEQTRGLLSRADLGASDCSALDGVARTYFSALTALELLNGIRLAAERTIYDAVQIAGQDVRGTGWYAHLRPQDGTSFEALSVAALDRLRRSGYFETSGEKESDLLNAAQRFVPRRLYLGQDGED